MSFFTVKFFTALAASFIATGAFAIIFQTNKRHLLKVCIAGLMTYFVFYTVNYFAHSLFWAAFVSTFTATVYGEICARISHAPALIFIVAGLIATVPGGDAYYSMKYLIMGENSLAVSKLLDTGSVAIGIACGIVCVSILFGIITDKIAKKRSKKQN